MKITVRLYGVHRSGRFKEEVREYPPGTTAGGVLEALQIQRHLLGTVLIDGVHATIEDPLTDGAALSILPILGGG